MYSPSLSPLPSSLSPLLSLSLLPLSLPSSLSLPSPSLSPPSLSPLPLAGAKMSKRISQILTRKSSGDQDSASNWSFEGLQVYMYIILIQDMYAVYMYMPKCLICMHQSMCGFEPATSIPFYTYCTCTSIMTFWQMMRTVCMSLRPHLCPFPQRPTRG